MWTALDWDLLKPWGCCFVEDVVTLQVSLLFTEGGWGGGEGVITSCEARWIESCWNLEDVASLKLLLLRLHREKDQWCSRSKQLLQKAFTWKWKRCDVHFVNGSPVNYDIFWLSTKRPKTMLHTCLAIHGRCKLVIFLREQTSSLSAPKM